MGALVLKFTSPAYPDVPFFQVDVNTGKHIMSLHLEDPVDRTVFETLLASADVILGGNRPGVATWLLRYSPGALGAKTAERGRRIVYIAEDCFGGYGVPRAE
ncbi:hypothetical protein ANO14919_086280 [Xylariales sp. No.14919]|nr:hypothetical protein F5X98DRAFT_343147 [Xylaria grammica]GAW19144.1 hypothetical protein ANO14919_086280 [Xylariales sp. No.14919]